MGQGVNCALNNGSKPFINNNFVIHIIGRGGIGASNNGRAKRINTSNKRVLHAIRMTSFACNSPRTLEYPES